MDQLKEWLNNLINQEELMVLGLRVLGFFGLFLAAWLADILTRRFFMKFVQLLVKKSRTFWDDVLLKRKVFHRLCHMAPAIVIYVAAPLVFGIHKTPLRVVQYATGIYMILIGLLTIDSFLNGVIDIYRNYEVSKRIPLRSFIQMAKIILYFLTFIVILSIVLKKDPTNLLTGLGAMTAVLLLIFKDSILGFVAGILISTNQMVRIGDWVELPKYGVDGDVTDISLTTVKVQNWDKTISTIPTYSLISDSFKNWRGMAESGGRRIMRAVNIDMSTIKVCTEEMLERFKKFQYITEYIERKRKEIAEYNRERNVDESELVNGRHLTNIGTFRAYVVAYLKNHPMINQDMTFIVRQLAPTSHGLPIQIYVFCKDKVWANYEGIQADIFDHILAILPEFELKVFQDPTGWDFRKLADTKTP